MQPKEIVAEQAHLCECPLVPASCSRSAAGFDPEAESKSQLGEPRISSSANTSDDACDAACSIAWLVCCSSAFIAAADAIRGGVLQLCDCRICLAPCHRSSQGKASGTCAYVHANNGKFSMLDCRWGHHDCNAYEHIQELYLLDPEASWLVLLENG